MRLIESFIKRKETQRIMEIKVLEQDKQRLRIELIGQTSTIANILTKQLWLDADTDVAGYSQSHPQTTNPVLILQTKKKDAKKVLMAAVAALKKEHKTFVSQAIKLAK